MSRILEAYGHTKTATTVFLLLITYYSESPNNFPGIFFIEKPFFVGLYRFAFFYHLAMIIILWRVEEKFTEKKMYIKYSALSVKAGSQGKRKRREETKRKRDRIIFYFSKKNANKKRKFLYRIYIQLCNQSH